jgi:hypothetical protein
MTSTARHAGIRKVFLFTILTMIALSIAACTHYRDPRAEVIITTNRGGAEIYLVPLDVQVPKPPTRAALQEYAMGSTSATRGIWVDHGRYWLLLEKDGTWSQPVEFEVRLDYLNKAHVEF